MTEFNPYEAPRSRGGGQPQGPSARSAAVKALTSLGFYWGIFWRLALVLLILFTVVIPLFLFGA